MIYIVLFSCVGIAAALGIGFADVERKVESARRDIAAQSAMQQRRYDDLVGLCERIEAMLEAVQKDKLKFYVDYQKGTVTQRPVKVMDYETSQIAALDEFKEN